MKAFSGTLNKYITAFFLGFSSGINYATLGATITLYLYDYHVSLILLGVLSLRMLPYSLKAGWAPVVDLFHVPWFAREFGQRKSWLVTLQFCLILCYGAFSYIQMPKHTLLLCVIAFGAAFFAATFDNTLEGYRIELFSEEEQGKGNALVALGFRIGFLFSSAFGLYLSSLVSWSYAFIFFALITCMCLVVIWRSHDGKILDQKIHLKDVGNIFRRNYYKAFVSFFKKEDVYLVCFIVAFFKVSDAFLDTLLLPFLMEMGFSKIDIANLNKTFGFLGFSVGTALGSYFLSKRYDLLKVLIFSELLAAFSNLAFLVFTYTNSKVMLFSISFFESLCSGLANVTIITFMSFYCKLTRAYTATFFAILSSLSLLNRSIFAPLSGITAEYWGWSTYFIVSTLFSIPPLICCFYLMRRRDKSNL